MKVICPNGCSLSEFYAIAHVSQYWKIDNLGNFIQVIDDCLDILHNPSKNDLLICCNCSSEAIIIDN